jgi:hypothetical protein
MKRKRYFAAILGMILTAGVFLAGCDNGNAGTGNTGELDGTWKNGVYEIIINGIDYVMRYNGNNYGKGTISYSVINSTFTFKSTHAWQDSGWVSYTETTTGTLSYGGGNTLVISNLDNYTSLAGTWTRGSGTGNGSGPTPPANSDPKTITITGFPGSAYSGKAAAITLHASLMTEEVTAIGAVRITGNSLNISLYTDESFATRWKGTGDYYVLLMIGNATGEIEKVFIYSEEEPNYYGTNVPTYSITESESTILYSEFQDITEWAIANGLI